jgi:chromosome partitioning protein
MILVFASSKGGVGKSTACAALASALALEGQSVLIIDLDQNQTLARWRRSFDIPYVTVEAIAPAQFIAYIDEQIDSGLYDHILIDLMGARERTQLAAYALADLVIIPAQASEPDLREAVVVAKDVLTIARETGRTIPFRLLLTKMSPLKTRVGEYASSQLAEKNMPCFQTVLVERVGYREMFLTGELPTLGEKGKGAGGEIDNLLLEIRTAVARNSGEVAEPELQEAV